MTVTGQDVLDSIRGDLYLSGSASQEARPKGLTASSVGVCHAQAGFLLNGVAESNEPGDMWRGMRGTFLHDGIQAARANGIRQFEQRVTVDIAGVTISGAFDEWDPETKIVLDFKTRDISVCHNPKLDDENRFQLGIIAKALGASKAFVVFVPFNGGFDDWSTLEVDIDQSVTEATLWLKSVIGEDQANLPRDKPPSWCEMFCKFHDLCRPGWVDLNEPISNPALIRDVAEAYDAINLRKAADKTEKAAKLRLEGLRGRAGNLEVVVTEVDPLFDEVTGLLIRRGYTKIDVKKPKK